MSEETTAKKAPTKDKPAQGDYTKLLEDLGYNVFKTNGLWFADKGGADQIGPAGSVRELYEKYFSGDGMPASNVAEFKAPARSTETDEAFDEAMEEARGDNNPTGEDVIITEIDGAPLLPGAEIVLSDKAAMIIQTGEEFKELSRKQSEHTKLLTNKKNSLLGQCRDNLDMFEQDKKDEHKYHLGIPGGGKITYVESVSENVIVEAPANSGKKKRDVKVVKGK